MTCPDENSILGFVERRLAPEQAAELESHLDLCPACRRLVSELAMSLEDMASAPVQLDRSPTDEVALERGESLGRYLILEVLGVGGMGVVYKAHDPELDRHVALKVLRPELLGENGGARLLREARSMARLTHPNVVTVHDVGTFGGQVYLAMEYVQGLTLKQWLQTGQRDWRAVVDIFYQAGRGLAAAHAAGLVHRDFKPDNTMIAPGGVAKVTDFGLARGLPHGPPEDAGEVDAGAAIAPQVTRTGTLVGTPAYMAPELSRGTADARTDQFSFCVALYEGLCGVRPFAGSSLAERWDAIRAGQLQPPPRESRVKVPPWLHRAVVRGLSAAPDRRHPSMDALLDRLDPSRRRGRRRWLLAASAGAVACLAAVTGYLLVTAKPEPCEGGHARWEAVYSPRVDREIRRAFLATGKPYAARAHQNVRRALAAFGEQWTGAFRKACLATRSRGEQTERVMELRMHCLNQRLQEARSLVSLLRRADASVVRRSVLAASSLSRLAPCSDVKALLERAPLPDDPAARERVLGLQRALAEVRALGEVGRYPEGLRRARGVMEEAKAAGHGPTVAEASFWLGLMNRKNGRHQEAVGPLERAARRAMAVRRLRLGVRAWTELVELQGVDLERPTLGRELARDAEAAIASLGGDPALEGDLAKRRGHVELRVNRLERALTEYGRSVRLLERAHGASHPRVANALAAEARCLQKMERYKEALRQFERARSIQERELGPDHPDLAICLNNMAIVYYYQRRLGRALSAWRRAARIYSGALGPGHPALATTLDNIGLVLQEQGDYREALALQRRALKIREQVHGKRHVQIALSLNNIGLTYRALGELERAREAQLRGLAIRREALGPDHPLVAASLVNLANVESNQGRHDQALRRHKEALEVALGAGESGRRFAVPALEGVARSYLLSGKPARALSSYQRALAMRKEPLGRDAAFSLTGIGQAQLALGRARAAIAPLERALELRTAGRSEPANRAETRLALARALWQAGEDRARARRLALAAHKDAKRAASGRLAARIEGWLQRTNRR